MKIYISKELQHSNSADETASIVHDILNKKLVDGVTEMKEGQNLFIFLQNERFRFNSDSLLSSARNEFNLFLDTNHKNAMILMNSRTQNNQDIAI
jgi:hypothetical protein